MPRQDQLQACYQMASAQRAMQAIRMVWCRHCQWDYMVIPLERTELVFLVAKIGKTKVTW
jgi:hypothetical protein